MDVIRREVRLYVTSDGKVPFNEWFYSLKDGQGIQVIRARLARARLGNLGDYKSVGRGVFEFRINFDPGYRIYFGMDGQTVVILVHGGDKGSQNKDISRAHEYWEDYGRRKDESK